MKSLAFTTLLLAAACALAEDTAPAKTAGTADKRLPIPPAAALLDSEKEIREVFKAEYQKKGVAERTDLAKRLLKLAGESKNDALAYYVALREARDVAASAGELDIAFGAVDTLAQAFAVDAPGLKAGALTAAVRTVATAEAAEKAYAAGLDLLDEMARDNQFDGALKLVGPLDDLARRANHPDMARTLQARSKELRAQQTEWARAKPLFDRLKADPEDAEAAVAAGKYYAASRGDWEHALPLFAKSAQAALKEAAAKDLLKPEDGAAQADVGDLWWSAAEKEKEGGAFKAAMQNRAAAWYSQALDGLTGLRKAQAEKRIQTASDAAGADWTDLLRLVNPDKHATTGKWTRRGNELEVAGTGDHCVLEIPKTTQGSYDLQVAFTVKEGARHEPAIILPVGAAQTVLMIDGWQGVTGLGSVNGVPPVDTGNPTTIAAPKGTHGFITPGQRCNVTVRVRIEGATAQVQAEFNGRKIVDWKGKQAALSVWTGWPVKAKTFGLGACSTPVVWHTAKVRLFDAAR
ncbi:MAG: hypothetical protein NTW87_21525 [Planctomycetota bacterium]|nr:hypothetical protein [Planctomycetota bacterium]